MNVRTILLTALVALALTAGAAGIASADNGDDATTVTEYHLDENTTEITLIEGDEYRLVLDDDVNDVTIYNNSDTENATVLLSTDESGEYDDDADLEVDGAEVDFTATSNLTDHIEDDGEDGYFSTNVDDVNGTVTTGYDVSLPPIDEDLLPFDVVHVLIVFAALVALVAGVFVGREA